MFSKDLFQESKKFIPGGVSSPVRAFEPYPFFVKKASGSKIYDVDGNKYIDHCLAYGPLILGHADPKVVREVSNQLTIGSAYGAPTENEIILAKEVVDRIPSAEMVRFVNSGGEATMSAIRLARGFTGKDKIIKLFDYNKKKYKDRNTHMYKKCPKCKQKIRLPLKKGEHTVKCPNCGNRFDVACHKDEKIKVEIIK